MSDLVSVIPIRSPFRRKDGRLPRGAGQALDSAAATVAIDMERLLFRRLTRRVGPPRSQPGDYPHLDTGRLARGVEVTADRNGIRFTSEPEYGRYLQEGTPRMRPRPWVTNLMNESDWQSKIGALAKQIYNEAKA